MIQSMTGFGRSTLILPQKKITVEVRSLNSKQTDITTRIPSFYKVKEMHLRTLVSSILRRGKIELSIFVENTGGESQYKINNELIDSYMNTLQEFSDEKIATSELLNIVMHLPDALKLERHEIDEKEWLLVEDKVLEAIHALVDFRSKEGAGLEIVIHKEIQAIDALHNQVLIHEKDRIDKVKNRISSKLEDALDSVEYDQNRLEQEMIYFIEKLDISEEKVRLRNHCTYFIETMDQDQSSGKKLGFIAQEIGREINTLGSKANHAEIQKLVVQMKDALEKIKEQLLNVL